jgi:hypothetical protein
VHLVGFIIWKSVTMHGHMNVKNYDRAWLFSDTEDNRENRDSLGGRVAMASDVSCKAWIGFVSLRSKYVS